MLSQTSKKQMLGCDDDKCLSNLGGELGVTFLIAGTMGGVGSRYILNLKLIDIGKAQTMNRVSTSVSGNIGSFVDELPALVRQLLGLNGPTENKPASLSRPAQVQNYGTKQLMSGPRTIISGRIVSGDAAKNTIIVNDGKGDEILLVTDSTIINVGGKATTTLELTRDLKFIAAYKTVESRKVLIKIIAFPKSELLEKTISGTINGISTQHPSKFGFIYSQTLFTRLNVTKKVQRQLDDSVAIWEKLAAQYKRSLPVNQYNDWLQSVFGQNGKVLKLNQTLTKPIIELINQRVNKLAASQDIDIIIDTRDLSPIFCNKKYLNTIDENQKSNGDYLIRYLFRKYNLNLSDFTVDFTNMLIEEINSNH
jgi:hypothetical protein